MNLCPDSRPQRTGVKPIGELALTAFLGLSIFIGGCADSGAPEQAAGTDDNSAVDEAPADMMADADGTGGYDPNEGEPTYDPNGGSDGEPAYDPNGSPDGEPNYDPNGSPDGEPNYDPNAATDGEPNYDPNAATDGAPASPDGAPASPDGEPNYDPNASTDGAPASPDGAPASPDGEPNYDPNASADGAPASPDGVPPADPDGSPAGAENYDPNEAPGGANPGDFPGAGGEPGLEGGGRAQAPGEETPEFPAYQLVMGLREGNLKDMGQYISSRARGDLVKIRTGKLSDEEKATFKKTFERPELTTKPRSKNGGRLISLKSGEQFISILVKKEGSKWKVSELTVRKGTKR